MPKIEFKHSSIKEKCVKYLDYIPRKGEYIGLYCYDKDDISKMHLRQFIVFEIIHLIKDVDHYNNCITYGDDIIIIELITPEQREIYK